MENQNTLHFQHYDFQIIETSLDLFSYIQTDGIGPAGRMLSPEWQFHNVITETLFRRAFSELIKQTNVWLF